MVNLSMAHADGTISNDLTESATKTSTKKSLRLSKKKELILNKKSEELQKKEKEEQQKNENEKKEKEEGVVKFICIKADSGDKHFYNKAFLAQY